MSRTYQDVYKRQAPGFPVLPDSGLRCPPSPVSYTHLAGAALIAQRLYDVVAVSQHIVGDCAGKERVALEYGQAVAYAVAEAAFFRGFQHGFHFLNAPGRGRCGDGFGHGLLYHGR